MKGNFPLIFLTGCINPMGMAFTKLQDAAVRRQHYIESLQFYLTKTYVPILFVENSGTDISTHFLSEISSGRLEILTFDGNNYDKNLGKGYGELMIINHAIKYSKLFINCNSVIKITGRYRVLNIIHYLKINNDNRKFISVDIIRSLSICESKFWICSKEFLNAFLLDHICKLNDSKGYYFEHALLYSTFESIKAGYEYVSLGEKPRFSGVYGTNNIKIEDSWFIWFRANLRFKLKNYLLKY